MTTDIRVTSADRTGITTTAGHMTWATAIAAAIQADPDLSSAYRDLLRDAHAVCTDQQWSQAALDSVRLADLAAARPQLSAAEIQARDAAETEHDNAVFRREILELQNQRGERSDATIDARIEHLRGEIR